MWKRLKDWWTKSERLETELRELRSKYTGLETALKMIALYDKCDAVEVADSALKKSGLTAFHITADCPEDRIYFVPKGWMGRPTDYL